MLQVDASRAEALPGVHVVLTPFNVPPGSVASDLPILDSVVRYAGDEVAAVAAESPDAAAEALELLDVSYEPLPFVLDPEEALKPGAPLVHATGNLVGGQPLALERGDAAAGFAEADMVIEGTYRTPAHSGAALEDPRRPGGLGWGPAHVVEEHPRCSQRPCDYRTSVGADTGAGAGRRTAHGGRIRKQG